MPFLPLLCFDPLFLNLLYGVTLLALGNGAPDIFASLSASTSSEGLYMSISSLMGGAMFITSIVSSLVIVFSPRLLKAISTFYDPLSR